MNDAEVGEFLREHEVFGPDQVLTYAPLAGGVSSDIWLVAGGARQVVVKTPLAALRVAADWQAPKERSRSEADWLDVASGLVPGVCPGVLAYDDVNHLLALEYLRPDEHRLWKDDLLSGTVDVEFAASVGDRLGLIHGLAADVPGLADRFGTDDLFMALRMDPYLLSLVDLHPGLEVPIGRLVRRTVANKLTLVHGDVSPKNILVGPDGPVFLDAETAWWGDPAFDVAFCLNHLLLKSLVNRAAMGDCISAVEALASAYRARITWESRVALEARVAALLPALLLARVDGRSPVEYLDDADRGQVRDFAAPLVMRSRTLVSGVTNLWRESFS